MSHDKNRFALLRKTRMFSGSASEVLALRQAARLLSIPFEYNPVSLAEGRMIAAHIQHTYAHYSPRFHELYREIMVAFAEDLEATAEEIKQLAARVDKLNQKSRTQ